MTGKRKRYTAEFKAKVALEALRGELTTAQLAAKHGIHQTMVGDWKRLAMEGLASVFSGKAEAQEVDRPGLRIEKDLNGQRHAPERPRSGPYRQLADEHAGERCSE